MSQLPSTSHEANRQASKEMRERHHALIILSLENLGEAIYEDIANHCGLEKHQVGRRLDELVKAGKIYNTLKTGLTSQSRKANKYAIKTPTTVLPVPENHYLEGQSTAADIACMIINKHDKLKQQSLFNE